MRPPVPFAGEGWRAVPVEMGFAVTRHCNLRCPHCIRDDVESFHELDPAFFADLLDQASRLFGDLVANLTGGEPLVHREFALLVEALRVRSVPWRMVSNGWHLARALPVLATHPPEYVRLSLSGGSAEVHDADRGRGSFGRVVLGIGLLRSRSIPSGLTMVVDRRDRHQLAEAVELADALGARFIQFILPQPVPGSVARDTDLPPSEWAGVVREVRQLQSAPGRRIRVALAYGAPSLDGSEPLCNTKELRRLTVDVEGRVSLCCQLSEYGNTSTDVVADLQQVSLAEAWKLQVERMGWLRRRTDPEGWSAVQSPLSDPARDALAPFPCMRCAKVLGKLDWLAAYPGTPWAEGARAGGVRLPVLHSVEAS